MFWVIVCLIMSVVFLALRFKIHQAFKAIGLPKFKSFFCGEMNPPSPLLKDRITAVKAVFFYIGIHSGVTILSIVGNFIAAGAPNPNASTGLYTQDELDQ